MTHPFLTAGLPSLLAHRGASVAVPPGNTAAAFAAALARGCDHLETDVQVTRDGVVVIFHDDVLDDLTDARGTIEERTWEEVRKIRYVADGEVTPHHLLRLDDALVSFPSAFFNIDVKVDPAVAPTVRILKTAEAQDRVCLASFSRRRLQRLRQDLGPSWCTAFAKSEIVVVRLASWLRLPVPRFGQVLQVPERYRGVRVVDRKLVEHCHRHGIAVHVWTVNDPERAEWLRSLGVDAIISDVPDEVS